VGAADPFYYEENNDDDLLNEVLRYRTGYLNLIEESEGQLDALHPQTETQHYVEFYYGNSLNFTGYIQMQSFDNEWSAYPRYVSLPVVSPVGLSDRLNFNSIYPPVIKTLGELLDEVLTGLNANYTTVYLPHIADIDFSLQLNSLVVSPWDENYHHSITSAATQVFIKPESYMYYLDGLCKAFGWMLHDVPGALMFTMFDHKGLYDQYQAGHIGDPNYKTVVPAPTDTVFPLTNWLAYEDNKAKLSHILPADGIELSYGGRLEDGVEVSLERTAYNGVTGYADRYNTSVCNLTPITNEIQVSGGKVYFDSNNRALPGHYAIALDRQEGILNALDGSEVSDSTLFRVRYYTKTAGRTWKMNYDAAIGEFIASLDDDDAIKDNIHTTVTVAANYIEAEFKLFFNSTYPRPTLPLIFFTNITFDLVVNNELYQSYRVRPSESGDVIPQYGAVASDSIEMPFSLYREGTNLIGTSPLAARLTDYPYMFAPRTKLNAKFKGTMPDMYAARMYSFWKDGWIWRIVALAFHPWNDKYTLTMQRSETLENN
jgi:hypothetical protein